MDKRTYQPIEFEAYYRLCLKCDADKHCHGNTCEAYDKLIAALKEEKQDE